MSLAEEKYLSFTTFRRSGEAVATPVWVVGLDDGRLGFWTSSGSGKAKRLGHTAAVVVQPSDGRGNAKDGTTPTDATAELVSSGPAFDEVKRKIVAKYGFMTKITRVLGTLGGIVKGKRIPYGDRVVVISVD